MRTLEELNQKPWYRFFKVVYVVMWLSYPLFLYVLCLSNREAPDIVGTVKGCLILTLVYVLFAEGIRKAFYYILLGQLFPKARKPQTKT
jgi:hypothetical protein